MISERDLARGFHGLWGEALPLLNAHMVHLFNGAYREQVVDHDVGRLGSAIATQSDTDSAVVAEFAFHLARLAHEQEVGSEDLGNEAALLAEAEANALLLIGEYEGGKTEPRVSLKESERSEGLLLLKNYDVLLSNYARDEIEFCPRIPGCGFVKGCTADLSLGDCLFEVKTVSRNIAGKDIRQLFVYLALQSGTGEERWSEGGFFNPRRGLLYQFSLDRVIPMMSGGQLKAEVFGRMLDFFAQRDIQLDTEF